MRTDIGKWCAKQGNKHHNLFVLILPTMNLVVVGHSPNSIMVAAIGQSHHTTITSFTSMPIDSTLVLLFKKAPEGGMGGGGWGFFKIYLFPFFFFGRG